MESPGAQLLNLLREEIGDVLLVAPFIKQHVLRRLIEILDPGTRLSVVTRWRPDEVAAGVSDLEAFDLLSSRPQSELRLCTRLHAKYYRAGSRMLVGSANLTGAALGWSPASNLELLIEATSVPCDWAVIEQQFMHESVPATQEIKDVVEAAAAQIRLIRPMAHDLASAVTDEAGFAGDEDRPSGPLGWLPHARQPSQLYRIYAGDVDSVSSEGLRQGTADLAALEVPPGLSQQEFSMYIRCQLLQTPLIQTIDVFAVEPQRFGAIRVRIGVYLRERGDTRDPDEVWQTLMRWLLFFFNDRYEVIRPRYSEVFQRKDRRAVVRQR